MYIIFITNPFLLYLLDFIRLFKERFLNLPQPLNNKWWVFGGVCHHKARTSGNVVLTLWYHLRMNNVRSITQSQKLAQGVRVVLHLYVF